MCSDDAVTPGFLNYRYDYNLNIDIMLKGLSKNMQIMLDYKSK